MRWATYRRLETLSARPQIQGTSAIHAEIHSLLRDIAEAERSIGRKSYASDEGIDATLALMHKLLEELQDQLPQLPRSMADCVAFAEIAQHWRETDPADDDSFLKAARPLVAGIHRLMKSRVADVPSEAIKLCRQARSAVLVELETEGTPAHVAARFAADKRKFEIERLRSRLAAKLPKTLDDIAALAVLALYWEGHLLKELAHKCAEDRIAIGDRALPTLLLAVSEFFGIDQNAFASSQLAQETNSSPRVERDSLKSKKTVRVGKPSMSGLV
jgi:hypothetical protein